MKLIVGLGNPGKEYENTRHNIGYYFLEQYALTHQIKINKKKLSGIYNKVKVNNEDVILLKPITFMNLSGICVAKYMRYFKINIEDVIIIHDDLDISLGNFKLKPKGNSGGHNGLKSIQESLNTTDYKRLKIGISNNKNINTKDYVLGKFTDKETIQVSSMIHTINELLDMFIVEDFEKLMNKYNTKNE